MSRKYPMLGIVAIDKACGKVLRWLVRFNEMGAFEWRESVWGAKCDAITYLNFGIAEKRRDWARKDAYNANYHLRVVPMVWSNARIESGEEYKGQ